MKRGELIGKITNIAWRWLLIWLKIHLFDYTHSHYVSLYLKTWTYFMSSMNKNVERNIEECYEEQRFDTKIANMFDCLLPN